MEKLFGLLDAEWGMIAESPASSRTLTRWAAPEFEACSTLSDVVQGVNSRGDFDRSDRMLRALVRRAAIDDLAARTALQCLMPVMKSLAWRYRSTDWQPDVISSVTTETLDRIRNYPLDRRNGSVAANIGRDVEQRLCRSAERSNRVIAAIDDAAVLLSVRDRSAADEAADILRSSVKEGVVTRKDAAIIFRTRLWGESAADVALEEGMTTNTLRRRRNRAEQRLAANVGPQIELG